MKITCTPSRIHVPMGIHSNFGRIGQFWWINGDPSRLITLEHCPRVPFQWWGTCGFGPSSTLRLEAVP